MGEWAVSPFLRQFGVDCFAKGSPQDLSGRRNRKVVQDFESFGQFELRDLLIEQKLCQFLETKRLAGIERNEGARLLAKRRVRHRDDGDPAYRRVLEHVILDLVGAYLLAAAVDEVVLATVHIRQGKHLVDDARPLTERQPVRGGEEIEVLVNRHLPVCREVVRHEADLAANVDQLFVVASVNKPGFSSARTDRILAACEWGHIPARLVLNKVDLATEVELENLRATYESIPIDVIETCATKGAESPGIQTLRELMRDKVSVFYGASGAGKSTLLNALQPGLKLKVGKISRYWETGKHTTTYSQMYRLDFGGYVIDTPGIRVFRLFGVPVDNVRDLFPDFRPFQARCKFSGCSHDHEPDCAVFDAVEDGELSASRYASYVELLDELRKAKPSEDEDVEPAE